MVEHCIKSGNPLMFVHDDGVYLCADGLRESGGRLECAYAAGCDPRTDADCFETSRALVGGDDFGESLDIRGAAAVRLVDFLMSGERLVLNINRRTIAIETERGGSPPPTTPTARWRGAESTPPARERIDEMATKTKKPSTKKKTKSAPKSVERMTKEARAEIAERLAGGKQDHEVPTAKEVANNAIVEAAAKGKSAKAVKAPKGEKAQATKPAKEPKVKRVSALDAAAIVLNSAKGPMNTTDLIKTMAERKLWTSPNGATPEQTLYAAIVREIGAKGKDARFKKMGRGLFAFNGKAG